MNSNSIYGSNELEGENHLNDDHEEHQDQDDGMLMGLYDDNEVTETIDETPGQNIEPMKTTEENLNNNMPQENNMENDILDERKENNVDMKEDETPSKPVVVPPVPAPALVPSDETTMSTSQASQLATEELSANRVHRDQLKTEEDSTPIQRKISQSTMGTYNSSNTINSLTTPTVTINQSSMSSSVSKTPAKSSNDLEALNDEIATLLLTNKITLTTSSKLQSMLRENMSMKEKITKLKALLSRSSKVSKETKIELEKSQRETARLKQRVESLANRPTHMDLLADFETNFDRALMSLHAGNNGKEEEGEEGEGYSSYHQSGGEDTRPPMSTPQYGGEQENVSALLLAELSEAKSRMEHLENLNAQLAKRSSQLTKENEQYFSQLERQNLKMSNFQLELRMAKMETENATREMKAKAASLAE